MSKLKVIDFFCGGGGFSEGFRQMGFEIIYGFDHWKPAIETFNSNFNLNCKPKNILDFKNSIEEIEDLKGFHYDGYMFDSIVVLVEWKINNIILCRYGCIKYIIL